MLRAAARSSVGQALCRGLATLPADHTGLLELRQYTMKPEGIKVLHLMGGVCRHHLLLAPVPSLPPSPSTFCLPACPPVFRSSCG